MKTGIVIINYNDSKTTIELLKMIKDYKILDIILIVDNASTDDSVKELKKFKSKKVEIIENNNNYGYGEGINIGVNYLKEKLGKAYVIISNPDVIIKDEKDLTKLIEPLKNKNIAIIGPTIVEKKHLNRGWKLTTPLIDIIRLFPKVNKLVERKKVYYNEDHYKGLVSEVDVVSGCFFIVKTEYFEKVNGFDKNVFLYYEENILAKKLKNINKKTVVHNEVVIIHNHSVVIDKAMKKIQKYKAQRKSQLYYERNYNSMNYLEFCTYKVLAFLTTICYHLFYSFQDLLTKGGK